MANPRLVRSGNYKSALNEYVMKHIGRPISDKDIVYNLKRKQPSEVVVTVKAFTDGPHYKHNKEDTVGQATRGTRKHAEQAAARSALEQLQTACRPEAPVDTQLGLLQDNLDNASVESVDVSNDTDAPQRKRTLACSCHSDTDAQIRATLTRMLLEGNERCHKPCSWLAVPIPEDALVRIMAEEQKLFRKLLNDTREAHDVYLYLHAGPRYQAFHCLVSPDKAKEVELAIKSTVEVTDEPGGVWFNKDTSIALDTVAGCHEKMDAQHFVDHTSLVLARVPPPLGSSPACREAASVSSHDATTRASSMFVEACVDVVNGSDMKRLKKNASTTSDTREKRHDKIGTGIYGYRARRVIGTLGSWGGWPRMAGVTSSASSRGMTTRACHRVEGLPDVVIGAASSLRASR